MIWDPVRAALVPLLRLKTPIRLLHILPDARSLKRVLRSRSGGIIPALLTAFKRTWEFVEDCLEYGFVAPQDNGSEVAEYQILTPFPLSPWDPRRTYRSASQQLICATDGGIIYRARLLSPKTPMGVEDPGFGRGGRPRVRFYPTMLYLPHYQPQSRALL